MTEEQMIVDAIWWMLTHTVGGVLFWMFLVAAIYAAGTLVHRMVEEFTRGSWRNG